MTTFGGGGGCYCCYVTHSSISIHGRFDSLLVRFKKLGQPRPLFLFIFGLFKQTIQFLQQMNVKNVMSIQYLAPGFEPTTFGT